MPNNTGSYKKEENMSKRVNPKNKGYTESELTAAVVESFFTAFIKTEAGEMCIRDRSTSRQRRPSSSPRRRPESRSKVIIALYLMGSLCKSCLLYTSRCV